MRRELGEPGQQLIDGVGLVDPVGSEEHPQRAARHVTERWVGAGSG